VCPIESSASNKRTVAFVTSDEFPSLTPDDRLAADALERRGIWCHAVLWDDRSVEWQRYDAIVLRSTWDYHRRLSEFLSWIDHLEAIGATLWNPPAAVRWNWNKRYLLTLAAAPLAPPPTRWFPKGSRVLAATLFDELATDEIVVKAAVSANADQTESVTRSSPDEAQSVLDALLAKTDLLVQPLVAAVRTGGELSLMFFRGVFSHAVRKTPSRGEFRVQERLGGTNRRVTADRSIVEAAGRLLSSLPFPWLYARVDVVETPAPVLIEVELIEPSLFLAEDPSSIDRFASAVRTSLV